MASQGDVWVGTRVPLLQPSTVYTFPYSCINISVGALLNIKRERRYRLNGARVLGFSRIPSILRSGDGGSD